MGKPKRPRKLYVFDVTYDELVANNIIHRSYQIEAGTAHEARRIVNEWYLEHPNPKPTHIRVKKFKPDGYNAPIP